MFGFLSNDPFYSALRSFGYNPVRLPKATLKPLQLFTRNNNKLHYLGPMSGVFTSRGNVELPKIHENNRVSSISGKKSGELNLGLGLSIVGSIISAFGGSTSGLDLNYERAKSISFQYEDVLEDNVEITQLDQFLTDADINPFSKYVGDLLDSDKVYVMTAAIKSQKFSIFPKASSGTKI